MAHPYLLSAAAATRDTDPIFILGITERSGTNFLFHLLALHPDCDAGGPIWENYLLDHADLLVQYAHRVVETFNADWRVDEAVGGVDALLSHVGDGLIDYLNRQLARPPAAGEDGVASGDARPKRLVTKTPSVRNLESFFRLFPHAPLLIVVRDGRAVVASGMRTFDWDSDAAMHAWRDAARTILAFDRAHDGSGGRYALVRYEDLHAATEETLRRLLPLVGLDVARYDFAAAAALPVVGSSDVRRRPEDAMHWQPVDPSGAFDPLVRSADWSGAMHARFDWVAGREALALGYSVREDSGRRLRWAVWNVACDARWAVRVATARLRRAFR